MHDLYVFIYLVTQVKYCTIITVYFHKVKYSMAWCIHMNRDQAF